LATPFANKSGPGKELCAAGDERTANCVAWAPLESGAVSRVSLYILEKFHPGAAPDAEQVKAVFSFPFFLKDIEGHPQVRRPGYRNVIKEGMEEASTGGPDDGRIEARLNHESGGLIRILMAEVRGLFLVPKYNLGTRNNGAGSRIISNRESCSI
jgi:hypothetical protein